MAAMAGRSTQSLDVVRVSSFAAVLALAGGCAIPSVRGDVEALNALQKRVDAAIVSGDTNQYLTMVTDDAVLLPPEGPAVVGKAQIGTWSREMSKRVRFESYAAVDDEVVVAGDWAFRRARGEWALVVDGRTVRESGKFIIIYRRQRDGTWLVARDIWNISSRSP